MVCTENVGLYRERRLFGNELLRERGWFVLPMKCFMVFGDDDVDDDVYGFIPAYSVPKTQKKRSCTAIVTEIALSLDGMKCDAAMRGVVLAVLLIGHAAAGSREQVQSAL